MYIYIYIYICTYTYTWPGKHRSAPEIIVRSPGSWGMACGGPLYTHARALVCTRTGARTCTPADTRTRARAGRCRFLDGTLIESPFG